MEELIRILLKWARSILTVCFAAAVISAVISLLLPAYFTSTVTFLPTNPYMMDVSSLFRDAGAENPVYLFGGGEDRNRIITLAESRALESYLIEKYDLFNHYEIDLDDEQKDYWVSEALRDHFQMVKTPTKMLIVQVEDKDPDFAATMANDIVQRLDVLNKGVIDEKKMDAVALYAKKVTEQKEQVAKLTDSLKNTILNNPNDTVMSNILEILTERAVGEYANLATIYDRHVSALNQDHSTVYIIEEAVPAVKRTRPVRSMIVIGSVLVAFFAMSLIAIFIEKFKEFNLEEAKA